MYPTFLHRILGRMAIWVALELILGFGSGLGQVPPTSFRVHLFETNDVIRVELDGHLFTEYHFRGVSRPFLYPILSASGDHLTRRWPQETVPGEEHDHPHHHGLWWAHGAVNGEDFWSEVDGAGKTVHQSFAEISSGSLRGELISRNRWIDKKGNIVASDERTMRFYPPQGNNRVMDFSITIFATAGDLVLGDTKEGSMAIRVAESMRVKKSDGTAGLGLLVNREGLQNGSVWGTHSAWCDYSGPVGGSIQGVAIFDHPSNPRHPSTWHARDYGLFAVNPFGLHDFEKAPVGTGDLKIAAGKNVTFQYRFLFHTGVSTPVELEQRYVEYEKIRFP